MRKFCSYALLISAITIFAPSFSYNINPIFAQENSAVSEEAKMLYEDAIEYKKKGKQKEAIDSYIKALRKDRTILAFDDDGLIEASYSDSVAKLKQSPNDIKLLEVCGFLSSVGLSDNVTAITYYEKLVDLVDDEAVKERTNNLIDRLRSAAEAQTAYDSEVAAAKRDERIRSWAEMEKIDNFTEERNKSAERSEKLNEAYSERESLQNRIPQMEEELKELQESYDKADRLWYTLKDELYERRRRRLKNDLAAKKEELAKAKKELNSIEKTVSSLEKEDEEAQSKEKASAFNSLDDSEEEMEDEDSAFNSDPSKPSVSGSKKPSALSDDEEDSEDKNESIDEEDEYSEEALSRQADEMSDEERKEQLDDLIDNL